MDHAGKPPTRGATINSLPNELLVRVFGYLEFSELLEVALVCRRWSRLSCTPSLFPHLNLDAACSGDESDLLTLRGFAAWLCARGVGPHVRSLDLSAPPPADGSSEEAQLVTTVLGELGGPGCALDHLKLSIDELRRPFAVSVWVQRLTALQRLDLTLNKVDVTVSLKPLAWLKRLSLHAINRLKLHPGVALPTSLTSLSLQDGSGQNIPQQVAALPALRDLELWQFCAGPPAGPCPLPSLAGSLRRLTLGSCGRLPAGLTALTGLEWLRLSNSGSAGDWEALGPAVAACSASLTSLWLEGRHLCVPPQLAACTRLQRLLVCGGNLDDPASNVPSREYELDADGNGDPRLMLPQGIWLAGLTHLAASAPVVMHNASWLADMASLEQLSLVRLVSLEDSLLDLWADEWEIMLEWCGSHAPLRRLCLWSGDALHPRLFDAALALARNRPQLAIERHDDWFGRDSL